MSDVLESIFLQFDEDDGWGDEGNEAQEAKTPAVTVYCDRCEHTVPAEPRCSRCGNVLPARVCVAEPFGAVLRTRLKAGVEFFSAEDLTLPYDQYDFLILKGHTLMGRPGKVLVFENAIVTLSEYKVEGYTLVSYIYAEVDTLTREGREIQVVTVHSSYLSKYCGIGDYADYDHGINGYIVAKLSDNQVVLSLTARSPEDAKEEGRLLGKV